MPACTFNDFVYSSDKKDNRALYNIVNIKEQIKCPETLSKHYSLSPYSIKALENEQFYLPQPDDFNDLFDSSPLLWDFTNLQLHQFAGYLKNYKGNTDDVLQKKFNENRNDLIEEFRYYLHLHLFSKIGLVCMTNNKCSDTMWGYYGNNEGFLVEFNHSMFAKKSFQGPFQINYLDIRKPLNPNDNKCFELTFLIQLFSKKDIWKHENEYRFIVETPKHYTITGQYHNDDIIKEERLPRTEEYPSESVLGIYLGFNFSKDEEKTKLTKDTYLLEFQSCKKDLKRNLLNTCIEKKYKMFRMVANKSELSLDYKPIKVTAVSDYKFRIELFD